MPPCTHVCQDYPDGDCLAACLQSFLIDNGKSPPTQKDMLAQAKANGLCGKTSDFVLDHNIGKFGALFGIDVEKLNDRKILKQLANGEGILVGCWNYGNTGQHHCVRFCEYVGAEKFRVMNPAPRNEGEKFPEMDVREIDEWKCDVLKIRLRT